MTACLAHMYVDCVGLRHSELPWSICLTHFLDLLGAPAPLPPSPTQLDSRPMSAEAPPSNPGADQMVDNTRIEAKKASLARYVLAMFVIRCVEV